MSETASATDLELLARYTRDRAEDAFAQLVRRHLALVHSAALRQVRSPQLAEEVAQSAFTDLARNAHRLAPDTIVAAWLYQVTRRTAIDVVRRESRRQLREQIATEMNAMNATTDDWAQIEPLLDDAMAALDDTDRAAVLLRYFENKSLREVGQTLGTSDAAAQKRVTRAVERLRQFFTKRGVTVGAGGLVVVISANAAQAAPVGLAATISTAVTIAGTTLTTTATTTAVKTIAMTTLQKTLVTATVAVLAGAGIHEARQASRLRDQVRTLQQQQAPLAEQVEQLRAEFATATNRLANLQEEESRTKNNNAELLRLRSQMTRSSGASKELEQLQKENNDLQMKVSQLEGRWFNVTNSPQFSMPYLTRDMWSARNAGIDDPMQILMSAAASARDGDTAKLTELFSTGDVKSMLSRFSKVRWEDVKGIQIVSQDQLVSNGQESTTIDTIWMRQLNVPSDSSKPPALEELMNSHPEVHRWHFSKTDAGWKLTDVD